MLNDVKNNWVTTQFEEIKGNLSSLLNKGFGQNKRKIVFGLFKEWEVSAKTQKI